MRSHMLGYEDADTGADPEENAQEDLHGLGAGTHCRQGRVVAIVADDQRVHGGIEILQDIAGDDGKGEQDDIGQDLLSHTAR